jgi:hypothetical protein
MIKLSKIEDFFVNQTKNIVFVCTAITFLTVAATAVYIGVLSTSTEDKITVAVSGQFNKFKELKIEEHNKKYKKQDINQKPKTKSNNLTPEQARAKRQVARIADNLNVYNALLGDDPVNKVKLEKYVFKKIAEVKGYTSSMINDLGVSKIIEVFVEPTLDELEKETINLIKSADESKVLPVQDIRRIDAREYLSWYFDEKNKSKREAKRRKIEQENKVMADRKNAKKSTYFIGILAIIFGSLLAFLVYMRIDQGIRLVSQYIAEDSKNT